MFEGAAGELRASLLSMVREDEGYRTKRVGWG